MSRWSRWLAGGVAAAATVVCSLGVRGYYQTAAWPSVRDPAALRREAAALCHHEGGWRELSPREYPAAMTALHPASISVSGERVYIGLVPTAVTARYHGYYVWPDTAARAGSGIEREESDASPASAPIN